MAMVEDCNFNQVQVSFFGVFLLCNVITEGRMNKKKKIVMLCAEVCFSIILRPAFLIECAY